jgi:4-hydroxy-tetrahydrodipicolinate reductase
MKTVRKMKIGISGASGRMGQEVKALVHSSGHEILVELNTDNFSSYVKSKSSKKPDLWIDFSSPNAISDLLEHLNKFPAPLVSGTTGLSKEQISKMRKYSKKAPVFWAPNMSVGVALVMKMLEVFGTYHDFDFQIDEVHHRHKKDRPSGTAILLQNKLAEVVGHKKLPEPISIRGGGVFGIHRIQAFSEEEVVTIEHTALNRKVFAKGALWAGFQILQYKSGYFEMKDLLKI